jgi:hypothetical protein
MVQKQTDVFVWIILSRDLSNVSADALQRICLGKPQRNWNQKHPYSDRSYLSIAQRFLDKVRNEIEFSLTKDEIQTAGDFPSIYHFWICDITRRDQTPTGVENVNVIKETVG